MSESPGTDKLQKVLAELGYGSRREMEQWIARGRVQVNGEPAHTGQRIGPDDRIVVDGKPAPRPLGPGAQGARGAGAQGATRGRPRQEGARVLVLNKPVGVICTRNDPEGRPTVFDELPPLQQGRWISVGRLDVMTSGLLLLTNDGELAHRMMHPSSGLDREYAVRVNGQLEDDDLARLRSGVTVDGDLLRFSDIRYYDGSGTNHWYHVVLMEGRNREVRRLFESVGLTVSRLKRVRFGPVVLPSTLRNGRVAEMALTDLKALYRVLKLPLDASSADRARARREGRRVGRDKPPAKAAKAQSLLIPYPERPRKR